MKQIKIDLTGNDFRFDFLKLGMADAENTFDMVSYSDNINGEFKNGVWNVSGEINSCFEGEISAVAMLGIYKDGNMIALKSIPVILKYGLNLISFSESIDENLKNSEAILYLWDTEDGMKPIIAKPVVFK